MSAYHGRDLRNAAFENIVIAKPVRTLAVAIRFFFGKLRIATSDF